MKPLLCPGCNRQHSSMRTKWQGSFYTGADVEAATIRQNNPEMCDRCVEKLLQFAWLDILGGIIEQEQSGRHSISGFRGRL